MKICFALPFSFVLFLILLLPQKNALGQGNFLPGTTISFKNDTATGFIRYPGWDENPKHIEFRRNNETDIQKLDAKSIAEFHIPSQNLIYKSRKIGVININPTAVYSTPPSLQVKDSIVILLREITSGPEISLLEYREALSSHYYLEKKGILTELINYPFYRLVGEKTYLQTYDNYKKQLPELLSDSPELTTILPGYTKKELRKFIDKYIESVGVKKSIPESHNDEAFIDLNLNAGAEAWREQGLTLKPKMTYGFGLRVSLPRKFHNRYVKFNMSIIPDIALNEIYNPSDPNLTDKVTLKTIELGIGTSIGSRKIRPFIGLDYAFPIRSWRSSILSPHAGIGYRRKFTLEVSHFANLNAVFMPIPLFSKPRITFNYYLNLNSLFSKK